MDNKQSCLQTPPYPQVPRAALTLSPHLCHPGLFCASCPYPGQIVQEGTWYPWPDLPALPGGQLSLGLRVEQDSRKEAVSKAARALPAPDDFWSP